MMCVAYFPTLAECSRIAKIMRWRFPEELFRSNPYRPHRLAGIYYVSVSVSGYSQDTLGTGGTPYMEMHNYALQLGGQDMG